MAGHNKWSKIKRKKGVADAQRAAVFTKYGKLITVSAKEGGSDPDMNFKLKLAVDKAKAANMPSDNIQRAIEKGAGSGKDGVQIEEVIYEVYGPDGIPCLLTCLTDNKNRALSDLKTIFSKLGGSMGGSGSVAWMFETKGWVSANKSSVRDLDDITLEGIDYGINDVEEDGDMVDFYSGPTDLKIMKDFLESKGVEIESAELVNQAKEMVQVDKEKKAKIIKFLEAIEELDDVDKVDTNIDF